MGNAMRIDSLKFARKLEAAGLDRKAAEAIAEGVNEVDVSDLATKADIATVREEITAVKGEIAAVKSSISDLKSEIFKHLWILGASVTGLTVTLNVAVSRLIP